MITSVPTISLLLVVFFVIAIVIAFVKKVNVGIVGMGFAILLALLTGLSWKSIISGFPSTVVVTIFAVTLFFGFFAENGTMEYLSSHIMWRFRKFPKFTPYAFFIMAMALAAVGGCDMVVFSAAMAFPIGKATGMKAHHTGAVCMLGSCCGSFLPWSLHGSTAKSIIETMNDGAWAETATSISWGTFFSSVAVYLVAITIWYFVFKSYKLTEVADMKAPVAATPVQKRSLIIIFCAFLLIVGVPALNSIIGGTFLNTINSFCGVAPICLIGAIANMLLLGNEKVIIKKRIPWNTLIMLSDMGMLLGLGSSLGVNDYLGELAQNIPTAIVVPFFVLLAGGMSLFSSSLSVVYPTLLPIAGALAISSGINPVAVMAGIIIGSATTAMSPLSTAGAMLMANCSEDICESSVMFNKMFEIAVSAMIILVGCGVLGMFSLWGIFSV